MASIRKRTQKSGAVSFAVLWRDQDTGKQTSMTFPTDAEAATMKRLLDANGQSFALAEKVLKQAASKAPTVADMLEHHLSMLTKASDGTIAGYRSIIENHLLEPLGALRVDVVGEEHIAGWVKREVRQGAARKSIANAMGLLSSAFKRAVRKGWCAENPCELVSLPNEKRAGRRATFLTRDEYELILADTPERHRLLVKVLVGTGMRFSEATALTWEDLHLDAKVPIIQVDKAWKSDERRRFYLGSLKTDESDRDVSITRTLADELAAAPRPHDLVFPNTHGGQLTNTTFHQHGWQAAVTAAKSKGLRKTPRPHDLRHSHASWLLQEGLPLFVVSRRLGHRSITTTTKLYGHIMPEAHRDAAAAMERALGEVAA